MHHTFVHSLVAWGCFGAPFMTLTDNFVNCLVKFMIESSCLAMVGSWDEDVIAAGLENIGVVKVVEG